MGFCAEHNAIAAMITAGESKIERIVATWKKGDEIYVIPPVEDVVSLLNKLTLKTLIPQ